MNLSTYQELNLCEFINLLNRTIQSTTPDDRQCPLYGQIVKLYRGFAHPVNPCQKTQIHVKYIDGAIIDEQYTPGKIEVILSRDKQLHCRMFFLTLDHAGNVIDVVNPAKVIEIPPMNKTNYPQHFRKA